MVFCDICESILMNHLQDLRAGRGQYSTSKGVGDEELELDVVLHL